mgnify:CR=1 FL=1|tara:strand:+ start:260 stop:622 length:363 start_codon:yes stop_codon:yes gene_type:complete
MGENDGDVAIHVFFRGESRMLKSKIEPGNVRAAVKEAEAYIWDAGVGETDSDPLFLFMDYDLMIVYRLAHVSRGYNDRTGKVIEYRVFNAFDEKGDHVEVITLERLRDIEEGEIREDFED